MSAIHDKVRAALTSRAALDPQRVNGVMDAISHILTQHQRTPAEVLTAAARQWRRRAEDDKGLDVVTRAQMKAAAAVADATVDDLDYMAAVLAGSRTAWTTHQNGGRP